MENIFFSSSDNILSIDLECWEQDAYFNRTGQWIAPSREKTVDNTQYLLKIFREKKVKATFFVLGTVAQAFPDLIRKIDREGHELATHGYRHINLARQTPKEFRRDLAKSIDILTGIIHKPILGYRAPFFSIGKTSMWALEVLMELGIKYDSSIFPIAGPRYGIPDFPRGPVRIKNGSKSIIEVPLSTIDWMGNNWPVAGGGYFRLLPFGLMRILIQQIKKQDLPFVTYFHPYEFSAKAVLFTVKPEPFSWLSGRKAELKTNILRKSMRKKQKKLLNEFNFLPFKEFLHGYL